MPKDWERIVHRLGANRPQLIVFGAGFPDTVSTGSGGNLMICTDIYHGIGILTIRWGVARRRRKRATMAKTDEQLSCFCSVKQLREQLLFLKGTIASTPEQCRWNPLNTEWSENSCLSKECDEKASPEIKGKQH